jgi:kojibiose phosphorylase
MHSGLQDTPWSIVEQTMDPKLTKHYEGAFTQGSGSFHIRGCHDEGLEAAPQDEAYVRLPANVTLEKPRHPRSKWGTYVPGITGQHPLLREELVNLPWILDLRLSADGERLDMDRSRVESYRRSLDMRTAVLERRITWKPLGGAALEVSFMRFVSRARLRVCVQQVDIRCTSGSCTVKIESGVQARVKTNGHDHFAEVSCSARSGMASVLLATDTGDRVALCSEIRAEGLAFRADTSVDRRPQCVAEGGLGPGSVIRLLKIGAVTTSRDLPPAGSVAEAAAAEVSRAFDDRDSLLAEHAAQWDEMWKACDVAIEGDDRAQRAVRFALYHLLRVGNDTDPRVPVCAKGWAGEAYFGHFFWDTEIYLLPFFLYTRPEVARALVGFRLATLDGARRNAAALGYRGARYPWESSVTGDEQCPNWQYADNEVHVTADVAHAIRHYVAATGDLDFLARAAETLVETSRYWQSRAERKPDGSVNLNGVMGPDEYTCFTNNNAYTNGMVKRALEFTREALSILAEQRPAEHAALVRALEITPAELHELGRIARALPIRMRPDGVVMQCDGFEDLEDIDFDEVWKDRGRHFGSFVSQERMYRSKCLKQADALMLAYLFPSAFATEAVAAGYDYYEPLTTHDSSLSCVIHSILASRLGRPREAWDFFSRALDIDLDGAAGGAAEGIHIANCGGIWQAIVLGFAGMRWAYEDGEPPFQPRLPAHWKSLEFPLCRDGLRHVVRVTRSGVTVTPTGAAAV